MRHLAIIETDENGVFVRVTKQYFEVEAEAFEKLWDESQESLDNWAKFTQIVNYGLIQYLHHIGALWMDENGVPKMDFSGYNASSFIDAIMSNKKYLRGNEMTFTQEMVLNTAISGIKKILPTGKTLDLDLGKGLVYLEPMFRIYLDYTKKDPVFSQLIESLGFSIDALIENMKNICNDDDTQ